MKYEENYHLPQILQFTDIGDKNNGRINQFGLQINELTVFYEETLSNCNIVLHIKNVCLSMYTYKHSY